MLIIFNWITIQSIILHSILFNYGSVHMCENSNKLGGVTSQSKLKTKWRPIEQLPWRLPQYLIWRPEERQRKLRRLGEQKYAVWNSNNGWDSFWSSRHLPLFLPSCCYSSIKPSLEQFGVTQGASIGGLWSKVWFPQTTTCPPFCSITHCNYFKKPPWGCLK